MTHPNKGTYPPNWGVGVCPHLMRAESITASSPPPPPQQTQGADRMTSTEIAKAESGQRIFAPYMVVNPGETVREAASRHRRDTGHRGAIWIAGINTGRLPA